jgi:hypothetical protein
MALTFGRNAFAFRLKIVCLASSRTAKCSRLLWQSLQRQPRHHSPDEKQSQYLVANEVEGWPQQPGAFCSAGRSKANYFEAKCKRVSTKSKSHKRQGVSPQRLPLCENKVSKKVL